MISQTTLNELFSISIRLSQIANIIMELTETIKPNSQNDEFTQQTFRVNLKAEIEAIQKSLTDLQSLELS